MELVIAENSDLDNDIQTIYMPENDILLPLYSINEVALEDYHSANSPVITRNQTNIKSTHFSKNGKIIKNAQTLGNTIDSYLAKAFSNIIKEIYSDYEKVLEIVKPKNPINGTDLYKGTNNILPIDDLKGEYYTFAYYLSLKIKYDKNKYKLNSQLEKYLTTFRVRFAEHVTDDYDFMLNNKDDLSLGNIMLIDDKDIIAKNKDNVGFVLPIDEFSKILDNGLSYNEIKTYLKIILDYRLQAFSILDYLYELKGSNLLNVQIGNLKTLLPEEYKRTILEFNKHKMQARKLTDEDFISKK